MINLVRVGSLNPIVCPTLLTRLESTTDTLDHMHEYKNIAKLMVSLKPNTISKMQQVKISSLVLDTLHQCLFLTVLEKINNFSYHFIENLVN